VCFRKTGPVILARLPRSSGGQGSGRDASRPLPSPPEEPGNLVSHLGIIFGVAHPRQGNRAFKDSILIITIVEVTHSHSHETAESDSSNPKTFLSGKFHVQFMIVHRFKASFTPET